jgi:hypothetical protein
MIEVGELYGRFASYARRIRRNNPDSGKTQATADNTLGFVGTIDISSLLDADSKAEVDVKRDKDAWVELSCDFSSVTPTALTVDDAVTVLNAALSAASVTDLEFAKDTKTGRLLFHCPDSAPAVKQAIPGTTLVLYTTEIQIKSPLAGALDFGQGRNCGGLGSYWVKDFADHDIGYSFAYDRNDVQNIDLEAARGTLTRMVIPANIMSRTFDLTTKFKDDELVNIIQGGTLVLKGDNNPEMYIIPPTDQIDKPIFTCEVCMPLYGQGTSQMSQIEGIERDVHPACTGLEGDIPAESKAWANYSYALTCTESKDKDGNKLPIFYAVNYDWDSWDALSLEDY